MSKPWSASWGAPSSTVFALGSALAFPDKMLYLRGEKTSRLISGTTLMTVIESRGRHSSIIYLLLHCLSTYLLLSIIYLFIYRLSIIEYLSSLSTYLLIITYLLSLLLAYPTSIYQSPVNCHLLLSIQYSPPAYHLYPSSVITHHLPRHHLSLSLPSQLSICNENEPPLNSHLGTLCFPLTVHHTIPPTAALRCPCHVWSHSFSQLSSGCLGSPPPPFSQISEGHSNRAHPHFSS